VFGDFDFKFGLVWGGFGGVNFFPPHSPVGVVGAPPPTG